jgi:hypothetical protein
MFSHLKKESICGGRYRTAAARLVALCCCCASRDSLLVSLSGPGTLTFSSFLERYAPGALYAHQVCHVSKLLPCVCVFLLFIYFFSPQNEPKKWAREEFFSFVFHQTGLISMKAPFTKNILLFCFIY